MEVAKYVALVTGGSRGIGRAIALALHRVGYAVAVNHTARGAEAAHEVVAEIEALGGRAIALEADVSRFDQAKGLVEAAEAFMPIGALVNNAGITKDGLLMRMSEADFDAVIAVNLKGAFNVLRHAVAPMMRRREGAVVNLSSVVGAMGNAGQANYAASKAGILGLTKSVAKEVAPRGITVNAVLPGYIQTDMTAALPDAAKEAFVKGIPLGRVGTAQDVAETVAFLCGPGARYLTGHEFYVDGGLRI